MSLFTQNNSSFKEQIEYKGSFFYHFILTYVLLFNLYHKKRDIEMLINLMHLSLYIT